MPKTTEEFAGVQISGDGVIDKAGDLTVDGNAETKELYLRKYRVAEVAAPYGRVLNIKGHEKKLEPLIEQKYDEIYEVCEKGNKLLY